MHTSIFDTHDGLGLADLVATGEVSPTELLDEAIDRIEAADAGLALSAELERARPWWDHLPAWATSRERPKP